MDTSDPDITFNGAGHCNHCCAYEAMVETEILLPDKRSAALRRLVDAIQTTGHSDDYDCVIGVSGGVDSTYVAYLVKKLGLRPLAVHMDNGWNSELAVSNIEGVLKKLNIDLITHVLDWEEFRDIQKSFLLASVSDAEIPTDHAIWAVLYQTAAQHNIKYILLGANYATESILPTSWTYGILDWRYIRSIHQRFGQKNLRSFPHLTFWQQRFYYPYVKRIKMLNILDYVQFDKGEAMRVLENELGWRPYGGKHYESIYTRFFQGYILPRKFNIDKRRAHLSTLIMSGQLERSSALAEMSQPAYAGYLFEEDMEFMLKKLQLTESEFERIMSLSVKTYADYPNNVALHSRYMALLRKVQIGKRMRQLGLRPKLATS